MAAEKEVLPLDIIQNILLLQPSKSLLRFKAVCKSWNTIISDHGFAKRHLRQSKSSKNHNVFFWKGCEEYYLAKFDKSKFQVETIRGKTYRIKDLLCSGDGLALLSTSCSESYLLWNPCSKQNTKIPCNHKYDLEFTTFGLCSGPTLGDYKIVARRFNYYAVFSCNNGSWSKKKIFPFNTEVSRKGGLFIDGFSFWILKTGCDKSEIFYFDPRDERFKKLRKPGELGTRDIENFSLTILRGCLCLYDNNNFGIQPRLEIWMMRDNNVDSGSWSKLMIIANVVRGLRPWSVITPLFFTGKNELVVRSGFMERDIGVYNSVEKKFEKFDVPRSFFPQDSVIVPCVDTLFFPYEE